MALEETATIDRRLDKIEEKIDKLTESMILLARAEERLINMESDRKMLWNKIRDAEHETSELREEILNIKGVMATANKLFWIIISISITAYATHFITNMI